jgi:hypothetical protein
VYIVRKVEDDTVFPTLRIEMKDLLPEAYFGGEEVPPYLSVELEGASSTQATVDRIRAIGTGNNSCGYIDEQGIHFHIPDDDSIRVDLSKAFVFVSQPNTSGGAFPTPWQVFFFLMEPAMRALFIGSGGATLVEKTDQTLRLCNALDVLWTQDRFLTTKMEMVESDEAKEKGLAFLMKVHEEGTIGSSSEMWEFWETFGMLLMERYLALAVTTLK